MVWRLEIHHIDVGQGDSTLFVARNDGVGMNQKTQVRSVLIDGGLLNMADTVHRYITTPPPEGAGLSVLDVMVATHYDKDHMNGLTGLIRKKVDTYKHTLIYDQGEQGQVSTNSKYIKTAYGQELAVDYYDRESLYQNYASAINEAKRMRRVTRKVLLRARNNHQEETLLAKGWLPYDWLLGREIMWTDAAGEPVTPASLLPEGEDVDDDTNGAPPTIKCVAANQYVLHHGGPYASGQGVDLRNEKSLAFVVRFNNFKYYIGGDIETRQEEVMMDGLNHTDTLADRVHAMKVSHHGSERSTSAAFLARLRPLAAFISCGLDNPHSHPRKEVLERLEESDDLLFYYLTQDRSGEDYETRVGYIENNDLMNRNQKNSHGYVEDCYTAKASVAGGWGITYKYQMAPKVSPYPGDIAPARMSGNILLEVSDEESRNPVDQPPRFRVSYYTADATRAGRYVDSF